MIAAHQIAFGKAAGAKKPYDAEIEYLESTGTQWIDTAAQSSDKVQFSVWVNATGNDMKLFGNSYYLGPWADISWLESVYRGTEIPQVAQTWDTITLEKSPKLLTVSREGDLFTASSWWAVSRCGDIATNGTSVPLFAHINPYGPKYGDNLVLGWRQPSSLYLRISFFKAWSNGAIVRDLIPVRKGNIGYMYDRVSGQLFGNQGTGEFVLGPDIIDYTAKDYIQDGLVAMWDGIENAGWGTHDPNTTVWKDLVGGFDLENQQGGFNDNYYWMDNGLYCNDGTSKCFYGAKGGIPSSIVDAVNNGNITCESVAFQRRTISAGPLLSSIHRIGNTNYNVFNVQFPVHGGFSSIKDGWGVKSVDYGLNKTDFPVTQENPSYIVVVKNDDLSLYAKCMYGNKTQESFGSSANLVEMSPDMWFCIGSMGHSVFWSGRNTVGDFYCVRIYSRALTAEEIAHNYEIDKARFGL